MRRRGLIGGGADALIVVVLVVGAFLVHDTAYMLRQPFWLDESWVAMSRDVSLGDLRQVSGPTPLGWTFLLRLMVVGGDQRDRLLPLIFAGLAAAAAYWLGRELKLGRIGGAGLGVVALFTPAELIRTDLKQYTAEAAAAIVVAALVVRVDRLRSRRSLVWLGVGCVLLLTVASTTLFMGAAAFAAVGISILVRREWTLFRDAVLVGVGTAVLWGIWAAATILPNQSSSLTDYWDPFYPPRSLHGTAGFLHHHLGLLGGKGGFGLPGGWSVVLLLLAAIVVLAVGDHLAVALLPVLAFAALVVAGWLRLFPVLDQRTSTWLLTLTPVLVYAGLGRLLTGGVLARLRPPPAAVAVVGSVVLLAVTFPFAWHARSLVHHHGIPAEDARSQVHQVVASRKPGDVVVVDQGANYNWVVYGGSRTPVGLVSTKVVATGYFAVLPNPLDVAMHGRDATAVDQAWAQAQSLAARTPGARIWIVREHQIPQELAEWKKVTADADVLQSTPSGLLEIATG